MSLVFVHYTFKDTMGTERKGSTLCNRDNLEERLKKDLEYMGFTYISHTLDGEILESE